MTFDAVKDKLHDYIDPLYDEATLNILEATRDNMRSGKEKTYTLEETIANIRKHRSNN